MAKTISKNQNFYTNIYRAKSTPILKAWQVSHLLQRLSGSYFDFAGKVLDVGCGNGALLAEIKRRYGSTVFGIDLSKAGVGLARNVGVNAEVGDIQKRWPYASKYFDVVIANEVIEHVVNPDHLLAEAKRVLVKKGILIVTTPNLACWLNRGLLLFGYQPFFAEVSTADKTLGLKFTRRFTSNRDPLGHLRIFTLGALVDILELHGFEIIERRGGRVDFFPKFLRPFDLVFSFFPKLATDLIVVVRKK